MVSQSAITPMHVRITKRIIELQGGAAVRLRNVVGIVGGLVGVVKGT